MICSAAVALAVLAHSAHAATVWDRTFYATEWEGTCATGMMQTPINLPMDCSTLPGVPDDLVTDLTFPVVTDPVTANVGNAVQVQWDPALGFDIDDDTIFPKVAAGGTKISDSLLTGAEPEYMLKMIPLQVHWHGPSEHSFGGFLAAMEAHIVTHVGPGEAPAAWGCDEVWEGGEANLENCIAVFGITYITSADAVDPPYFANLFDTWPRYAGNDNAYPGGEFDLNDLLPEDKSYYSYIGSLTTPPCSEGLRWHVFSTPVEITIEAVEMLEAKQVNTRNPFEKKQLYRHNNRPVQPLNERDVYCYTDSS